MLLCGTSYGVHKVDLRTHLLYVLFDIGHRDRVAVSPGIEVGRSEWQIKWQKQTMAKPGPACSAGTELTFDGVCAASTASTHRTSYRRERLFILRRTIGE